MIAHRARSIGRGGELGGEGVVEGVGGVLVASGAIMQRAEVGQGGDEDGRGSGVEVLSGDGSGAGRCGRVWVPPEAGAEAGAGRPRLQFVNCSVTRTDVKPIP